NYFKINQDFSELLESKNENNTFLNSAWIMYRGITLHLSFLSFGHESELRRVVTNAYKYGYPGQLSETNPAIINEMADGSRVTVIRPKLSESWAFFIRKKYDTQKLDINELLVQKNNHLATSILQFLIKGNRTVAITGNPGAGKTTLLMALIEFIHPAYNLRIQETAFELNLRTQYPKRNILSMQETETYSGQDALDLQKKTDGHVSILGEVASDRVAAWMIQSAQVASLFTIFTHHARTFSHLVDSLRNALKKADVFDDDQVAEEQVVKVLEFDVHLKQNKETGDRFIARITECVPIQRSDETEIENLLSKETSKEEKTDALIQAMTTYFQQKTQRKQYIENTILEYRDGEYVAVNPISRNRQEEMLQELTGKDYEEFKALMNKWGA
ncbi:TPA: Flp pilus assembly complex ATPase component TadA, partial [Salmonella enterica subsp. enterica serovar Typhi str. AG3]|nr:Flp pilus assembly complex ATPase component TadA [Salmonella enterica subsp. enterica serovar Typhi str. AG3]